MDKNFQTVQAIAIKDGRILAAGKSEQLRAHEGPKTRVIDLKGKTVLPGLYDSHTHPLSAAMLSISFLCLIVWLFALRRQGEETTTVIGHRWNPARMERLTGQLEAINASLSRLGQ